MVKRLPASWETWAQSLGREDLLEKEMAPHSSILAWKNPWTEEPDRLQSVGSQRVIHDEWFHFHFSAVKHVFWFMQFYIIDFNFLKLTWSSVSSFPLEYSGKEELVFIISSSDSKMWLLLCAIPICCVHSAPYHGRKDLKNVPPFPVLASHCSWSRGVNIGGE